MLYSQDIIIYIVIMKKLRETELCIIYISTLQHLNFETLDFN